MLETKYYKDYRHNYLIIRDNGCLQNNVYQCKMITENRIKGLLPCQERFINGDILLYYEITSKQSVFSIYENKSIGREQLYNFFVQLKIVNDMLQKYLLDGNGIVLLPEYIFQNLETSEYSFLYYPEPEEDSFSQLMEFFIARVDNEDMKAVELVYKIADLIHSEQFVLDEVLKWFQEDTYLCVEEEKSEYQFKGEEPAQQLLPDKEEQEETEDVGNNIKRKNYRLLPVAGAGILGIVMLCYIMVSYELSYQEEIYLMLGLAGSGLLIVGSLIYFFYSKFMERLPKGETSKEEKSNIYSYRDSYEEFAMESKVDAGNTIFIPWTENCENKLYSTNKKFRCHIDLGKLPLTVGKLAGAVDMVIDESSISRMHAKFSRKGNEIHITDLNSTNGTFRNGVRLSPNASEIIEPGDEIRLGKLKFIYR